MISRASALAAAAGVCVFLNSLHGDLIFDDVHAVQRNQDVLGVTGLSELFFNDFWGEPIASNNSHKSYRPLTVLTFRANHFVHGLNPTGYHVVNVCLHAVVSALVSSRRTNSYKHINNPIVTPFALKQAVPFYMRVLGDSLVAATGGLLFALHPVHCEAVASVVGRAELLGLYFSCRLFSR